MLRIEFTAEELTRLRVADAPDPLWETALSLHLLQNRQAAPTFDPWRREVRGALSRAGLTRTVGTLLRLCPDAAYFPDFLTPSRGTTGLEESIDLLLSTPRQRLRAELARLFADAYGPQIPHGARLLAEGDPDALRWLGTALRRYHAVAVAPYAPAIRAAAAADRGARAEAALAGGMERLLAGYGQAPEWRVEGRTLHAPYPRRRELRLAGRGLTLIPSFFCVRAPVALVDEELPPVLVHPLAPQPGWLARAPGRGDGTEQPVAQLIGTSRAQLLESLDAPLTTTELAAVLRLSASTASRHAAVLREAGLITSRRRGNAVLHTRTELGASMLDGVVSRPRYAG